MTALNHFKDLFHFYYNHLVEAFPEDTFAITQDICIVWYSLCCLQKAVRALAYSIGPWQTVTFWHEVCRCCRFANLSGDIGSFRRSRDSSFDIRNGSGNFF